MNKGNISEWNEKEVSFHLHISQVSSVRLFKMFSGFRMFIFVFSHHSGAAGDKRRRKIRTKTKKKNVDHTNNFKLTEKKTFYTLFYHKWSKPCKLLRMHNEFYTSYVKWISMSNSARGTGEPLLIGSEASCIIMDQASLLSHCGSSWITRRERERDRERGRERERKGKQRPQEQAGKGGWWREEGQCSSQ